MRNGLKLAAMAGMVVMGVSAANANPITLLYSFDGTNFMTGTTSTTGQANFSSSLTNAGTTYTVQFSATGSGPDGTTPLPAPNFNTNTITATASGGGTLYLAAVESAITNTNVGSFRIGFTNNDSDVSVTEAFFVGTSLNLSSTPLASSTMAPNSSVSQTIAAPTLTSGYQVGEVYKVVFASANQQVNATISERALAVPEPVSIALLGTGLVGVGMIRRRRR